MTIQALKNIAAGTDGIPVEELLGLYAFGTAVQASYSEFSIPAPGWVDESMATLKREIKAKHRDILSKMLAESKARREGLRTAEEKRGAEDARIAELEKALASY